MSVTDNKLLLGYGTYGNIWRISETEIAKESMLFDIDNDDNVLLEGNTVRELCFLKTFKHCSFRSLTNYEIDGNKIIMYLPDAGITLEDWVKKNPKDIRITYLPVIVGKIAEAMLFMEQHKMNHGDIKPTNIMLDNEFNIRLIDFGAVNFIMNTIDENRCTEIFAAPELLSKKAFSPNIKSDIWSLGMTISYILTGGYYNGTNVNELISTWHKYNSVFLYKCQMMFALTPKMRPSAREILEWDEISDGITPRVNELVVWPEPRMVNWRNFPNISLNLRKYVLTWISHKCVDNNTIPVANYAIRLLTEYMIQHAKKDFQMSKFLLLASSCLIIMASLLASAQYLYYYKPSCYSFGEYKKMINHVLIAFDYKVWFGPAIIRYEL